MDQLKDKPERKDVEEPLLLLVSCRDPMNKVTTKKEFKQKNEHVTFY